jgi:lipoprotein NlpD
MNRQIVRWGTWTVAACMLVGCAVAPVANGRKAPVMEYGAEQKTVAPKPQPVIKKPAPVPAPVMDSEIEIVTRIYVVQKGDTLYSIAFLNGVDYRDVADWNKLDNPAAIQIGQQLQLRIPVSTPSVQTSSARPVMDSQVGEKDITKTYPKVGKLAYTDQALTQAERLQNDAAPSVAVAPIVPPVVATIPPIKITAPAERADDEEQLEWGMPTNGKMISGFSENDNRKGVDIVGQRGQAVVASAAGKVVYSGSGLRGYGKLVIIKHNKTYLSAYAHNDQILVKEGQTVTKGQKIAEMGNSDADQVKLHFEIRKLGKPVDPAKYLLLVRS